MGAWRYCTKCGEGMPTPTDRQVISDEYPCPHCGEENDPIISRDDVLLSMLDRIEAIEVATNIKEAA